METFWFVAVAFMIAMYVLLDGFDLGAGAIHPFVARNDDERRMIIRAIGPVWDGNEVWLIAAGGTLFFAFPQLYASSFSGFYLPLIMVLWLLMIRGLSIELRSHLKDPLWASFWDAAFFFGSALLVIFFGAALGNVVRGVPVAEDGYFFQPLWTNFSPTNPNHGIDLLPAPRDALRLRRTPVGRSATGPGPRWPGQYGLLQLQGTGQGGLPLI